MASLAEILSSINPNIDADILKAARYFSGDTEKLLKRLLKPSSTEKSASKRLKELKSEDVLRQEVSDLFASTRQRSQQAISDAGAMGESLAQGIAAAASGVGGVVGGDPRVASLIANAGLAAQAPSRVAASGLRATGEAGLSSTSEQEALAIANALVRRTGREQELKDIMDTAKSEREAARLGLRGDQRSNFLSLISSLLGMRPSGGYGGSGTGTTSTGNGGGNPTTADVIKYLGGGNTWAGAGGYKGAYGIGNITTGNIPAPTSGSVSSGVVDSRTNWTNQPPRRTQRGPYSFGI